MQEIDFIKPSNSCFILGVAGGSGSGKTFFASRLRTQLGADRCQIVFQDSFYHDQSKNFDFDGGAINFDHPDSIDFTLLAAKLGDLKKGLSVDIPVYDFTTHSRLGRVEKVASRPIIIVDGILIFHVPELRELFDELIFFATPETLRLQRRLQRDTVERGRTEEGVRQQFMKQVKPMHDLFVEPSKHHARVLIRESDDIDSVVENMCQRILRVIGP